MQSVWVMGDREEVLGKVGWPDVQGYLEFGGSVMGNETWWPRVDEFFEAGVDDIMGSGEMGVGDEVMNDGKKEGE